MNIIREKREQFRVDIRRRATEAIFRINRARLIPQQISMTLEELFSEERIQTMQREQLYQFYTDLYAFMEIPITFPIHRLTVILQSQFSSSLFTIVFGFIYKRGEKDPQLLIDILSSNDFIKVLEAVFDLKNLEQATCLSSLQLLSQGTFFIGILNREISSRMNKNVHKLLIYFEKILRSRNPQYLRLTLEIINNITQSHIGEICKFTNLPKLLLHENLAIRNLSIDIIGQLCCYGNNLTISQLWKNDLLICIESTMNNPESQIRIKTAWIIGNICRYPNFITQFIERKTLITKMINCIENDYYAVSKECIIALTNILENTDLPQLELKFQFMNPLLDFWLSNYRDKDLYQNSIRLIHLILDEPVLVLKIKQRPQCFSWLIQQDEFINEKLNQNIN